MSKLDDIKTKVTDYLDGDYDVTEAREIPSVEDLPFGKVAKKMNMCVFYIDLRDSSGLLISHQKQTAGKIHKSFLYAVSSVVRYLGGYIRSFNGDSLLAFWPANYKSEITKCVRAGMTAKWLLDIELSPLFEKYQKLDFGIGIDWGEVFIARAGLPRDTNNNDLIFMGNCVNYAVAIGEQAKSPYHVEISTSTYSNLEHNGKYKKKNGTEVDMWKNGIIKWKGKDHKSKITS